MPAKGWRLGNKYEVIGDIIIVYTSNGKHFIVDSEDLSKILPFTWGLYKDTYVHGKVNNRITLLHRFLLNAPDNLDVDHKDGNGLNNRRSNIRVCSESQNMWNMNPRRSFMFKGVNFDKTSRMWRSSIGYKNNRFHLGRFNTPEEAAYEYMLASNIFFGEFSNTDDKIKKPESSDLESMKEFLIELLKNKGLKL